MTTSRVVKKMLAEDDRRMSVIFGKHNQYTGYNMELHDYKCVIPDMGELSKQFLTEEVYNNDLYQAVMKAGSISNYVAEFNEKYAGDPELEPLTNELCYEFLVFARLARDPSFAFYCLFQIAYKSGGTGPFELNYPQRYLLCELEKLRTSGVPIRIVLLKARQWGGSTLVQLYMAWLQLFVCEQWNSIIIAQVKDTAKVIKAMYTKVLSMFPSIVFGVEGGLQFSPFEKSQDEYIITDSKGNVVRDCRVGVGSYEKFAGLRGHPYHMAHFSEVAYWRATATKNANEVVTNVNGGLDDIANTLIVMESTPCGNSGFFYEQYQLGKNPDIESLIKSLFIPFYFIERDMRHFKDDKERYAFARKIYEGRFEKEAPDVAHESGEYVYSLWEKGASLASIYWYITKRSTFTDFAQMASEAPSDDVECFAYSGHRQWSIKWIEYQRARYARKPLWRGDVLFQGKDAEPHLTEDVKGPLCVWKHRDKVSMENRYLVIVDPGGVNPTTSDPNVITVIDRLPLLFEGGKPEVVARWRGWIRYDQLTYKAIALAQYYDNAKLAFESNTYDRKRAISLEFTEDEDHTLGILNVARKLYRNLYMRKATNPEDIKKGILTKVGYATTKKTKPEMVDHFTVMFEDDQFIDPDSRFYDEASIYEKKPEGGWGNMEGTNSEGTKNHDDIVMTDMIGCVISRDMPLPCARKITYEDTEDYGTLNESAI